MRSFRVVLAQPLDGDVDTIATREWDGATYNAVAEHLVDDEVLDVEDHAVRIGQLLAVLVQERLHDIDRGVRNANLRCFAPRTAFGAPEHWRGAVAWAHPPRCQETYPP